MAVGRYLPPFEAVVGSSRHFKRRLESNRRFKRRFVVIFGIGLFIFCKTEEKIYIKNLLLSPLTP
jgi:hypothetical protein